MEWYIPLARRNKRFRTVYAHNGGGWDWISLVEHLRKDKSFRLDVDGVPPKYELNIARAQSKMVLMVITFPGQFSIKFCDSQYLLRSKLADLAKDLGVKHKVDLQGRLPHEVYIADRTGYFDYLRGDCETLLLVLEKSLELLRTIAPIDRLGTTIGSTAMKVFRTGYLQSNIDIPENDAQKTLLREGYRGGRVEVFKYGYHPKVFIYDVNSLYPAAMVSSDIPVSGRMVDSHIFRERCIGVYRITFRQYRNDILPILMVGGVGVYKGEGVYFSPEIALLKRVDPDAIIEVKEGFIFPDVGRPFDEYVNTLFDLRKKHHGKPIALLAKYLLNSLYGKFAQRSERESVVLFEGLEAKIAAYRKWRDENRNLPKAKRKRPWEITPDGLIVGLMESTKINFEHVGIAGIITSQARVLLYNYFLKCGKENVIYGDTDSVHTTVDLLNTDCNGNLGGLKCESGNTSCEGVYCGKKLYAIREYDAGGKTKERIRAKGVSVGGSNGCNLRFSDLLAVANGQRFVAEFKQPGSILDCLKGKGGICRIGGPKGINNRKRTLQRT